MHPYSSDHFIGQSNIQIDEYNSYSQYMMLNFAETACEKDTQCVGVFDASCDQRGPFGLIRIGYMTLGSSPHCIYEKKVYDSKYNSLR